MNLVVTPEAVNHLKGALERKKDAAASFLRSKAPFK